MSAQPVDLEKINHDTPTATCARNLGCRRPECVKRARKYNRDSKNLRLLGRSLSMEIGPVRHRLICDTEAGYTKNQLARMYGVPYEEISAILNEIRARVTRITGEKILRGQLTERPLGQTPVLGTMRRLRGLMCDGYTQTHIRVLLAERGVEVSPRWISDVVSGRSPTCFGVRAHAVEDIFEKLVMTPGPSEKARAWGRSRGWARMLAWDPETIDEPAAQPDVGDDHTRCTECRQPMLTEGEYWSLSPDERVGFKRRGGHGLCKSHYQKAVRSGTNDI